MPMNLMNEKSEGGADVDYQGAAQSRRLALYHECTFCNTVDCHVLVLEIDGRDRGETIPGHIDGCRFGIILIRHFIPEEVIELSIPIP